MRAFRRATRQAIVVTIAVTALFAGHRAHAADSEAFLWESRPYRVVVELDATRSTLNESAVAELAETVQLRLDRRVRPYWVVSVTRQAAPKELCDKRLRIDLSRDALGSFRLSAEERDEVLGVTGPVVTRVAASAAMIAESAVGAAIAAFRPLARYDRDADDPGRVRLAFRGTNLAGVVGPVTRGELLTPFLVRRRESEPTTATRAAWTYLLIDGADENSARVVSHTRRPFRAGRRGRVERLAIVTAAGPGRRTVLRLHAHDDPKTPLPGYEVLVGDLDGAEPTRAGFTDRQGELAIESPARLAWATVRCGEVTVAVTPFAPGVDREVILPLLDERPRLRAEATLSALREELIDTVARKKILAGRVRKAIADGRVADARLDLGAIEGLPGPTAFARRIEAAERSSSAEHPVARQRLEKLFATTRTVLSKALDPRETRELAIAVDRAAQRGAEG